MLNSGPYIGSPENPKTIAIVSYITFIGWLIAYFLMYPKLRTAFSSFHLRQSLLIHLLSVLVRICFGFTIRSQMPVVYGVLAVLSGIIFFIWLVGFIRAINGSERPVPLIGKTAQQMFPGL